MPIEHPPRYRTQRIQCSRCRQWKGISEISLAGRCLKPCEPSNEPDRFAGVQKNPEPPDVPDTREIKAARARRLARGGITMPKSRAMHGPVVCPPEVDCATCWVNRRNGKE